MGNHQCGTPSIPVTGAASMSIVLWGFILLGIGFVMMALRADYTKTNRWWKR